MTDSKIRNIFTQIPLRDLIIDQNSIPSVVFMPGEHPSINKKLDESHLLKSDYIYLAGEKKVIIRGEDAPLVVKFARDNPGYLFSHWGELIAYLGYQEIPYAELLSYDPPGGYLYNQAKQMGKSPLIIVDKNRNAIGVTTFDYIVRKIRKSLETFY